MTDTTQTSPVPESEMNHIRRIFERAANAIVQASELSVAVEGLRTQVQGLVADIDKAQAHNRELDTMLHDVREQRDHAKAELSQAGHKLDEQERVINTLRSENEAMDKDINYLRDSLHKAQDESKGWEQAALKADAEAQEAKAMLDKLQSIFGQGLAASRPKPEPVLERTIPHNDPAPSYSNALATTAEDHGGVAQSPEPWNPSRF